MSKLLRMPGVSRLTLDDCGDVLTVEQLAKVLVVGRNSAYQLVADGHIRAARIGRRGIRIPKIAVIAFLEDAEREVVKTG